MLVKSEASSQLNNGNLRKAEELFKKDLESESAVVKHDAYEGLALIENNKLKEAIFFKSKHRKRMLLFLKNAIDASTIPPDACILLMNYYNEIKQYQETIITAKNAQERIINLLNNKEFIKHVPSKDDFILRLITITLVKGNAEFLTSNFSNAINTYKTCLNELMNHKDVVNNHTRNIGTILGNILQNYTFIDNYDLLKEFESSDIFLYFFNLDIEPKIKKNIDNLLKVSNELSKFTKYGGKGEELSEWISDYLEGLSRKKSISDLNKFRKNLLDGYFTEFRRSKYVELRNYYLELSQSKIDILESNYLEIDKKCNSEKKQLKEEKSKLKINEHYLKDAQKSLIETLEFALSFSKRLKSLHKAFLSESKRNFRITRRLLVRNIPRLSINNRFFWFFYKNLLLIIEIIVYVLIISYVVSSYFKSFSDNAYYTIFIGIIFFFIKRYIIAPRLEKPFFKILSHNVLMTIVEVNGKYSIKYSLILKLIDDLENPENLSGDIK